MLLFVTLVTMFGGYLVKIYAWRTILGTTGILNTGLQQLGLIDQPLSWLLYDPSAVVITLTHFLLPFAVLPIYGSLRGVADAQLAASRDLGARSARTLVDVVLPRIEWPVAPTRPAFCQGSIAGVPSKLYIDTTGAATVFVAGSYLDDFLSRLPVNS